MPLQQFDPIDFTLLHRGKVRDSFAWDNEHRLIVVTDRLSAFNLKLKTIIPNKGAVLNTLSNFWFEKTKHIIKNHLVKTLHPNMSLVREAKPIRIEMVLRAYLAGSLWRAYEQGQREFDGLYLPEGLKQHDALPSVLITPTTKDEEDLPLTESEILDRGLLDKELWLAMKTKALELFAFGQAFAAERGLILVDTKYEFGLIDGELVLIDEIHTPDSSRYWSLEDYQHNPLKVKAWDKELIRTWLSQAKALRGEYPLVLPSDLVLEASNRYLEIFERLTGKPLLVGEDSTRSTNLIQALDKYLN